MIALPAVFGLVAYARSLGEFVAGLCHNDGIYCGKMQLQKFNGLIKWGYLVANGFIETAEEINIDSRKTLGYACMVGYDTVAPWRY